MIFFCVGVMYSGEYDACDVTLSVYRPIIISTPGKLAKYCKGRRFDSHRGQAYFPSLPGVDIHSECKCVNKHFVYILNCYICKI
jgi:hypothetical protein